MVHALHNGIAVFLGEILGLGGLLALFLFDWTSWLIMLGIIVWAISRERHWLQVYLRSEVRDGLISQVQYERAQSPWAQTRARLAGLPFVPSQSRRDARAFYELLAELAQKKHQLAVHGDEGGNQARITELRTQIARLGPKVTT
jgi:hypothetical protein